jgi:hypothetical protein
MAAMELLVVVLTLFGVSIGHVVFHGPKNQVVWANTSWVVTDMCDVFSLWPLSVFKEPRYAVGVLGL